MGRRHVQVGTAGQPLGVLIEHRVNDVHERLVAVEQPMAAGQQVALEPALAQVLGEHLHHPALGPEILVVGAGRGQPCLVRRLEHCREPVRRGLVGPHQPEPVAVADDHVAQKRAKDLGGLGGFGRRLVHGHGVIGKRGQVEISQQQPAVGMRIGAHPALPGGRQLSQIGSQRTVLVEQFLGHIAAQPGLELGHVLRVGVRLGQRNLVRPPGVLDLLAVHLPGPGPALRRAQNDHRPQRPARLAVQPRRALDCRDLVKGLVERGGQLLVNVGRVVTGHGDRPVAVAV